MGARVVVIKGGRSKEAIEHGTNGGLAHAFAEDAAADLTPPDTGDLGRDLRQHLRNLAEFLTRSDAGAVFRALTGQAQHDPLVATRLRETFFDRQRERDLRPLEHALARGELTPGADLELAVDELVGPIYYRVLVAGTPVPPEFTDQLVARTLHVMNATF